MNSTRGHFFTVHELLIMAVLAALGGALSTVVSMAGQAVHAAVGIPGGLQFLAGIHVLPLVLALGLIRKPGAATVAGLLKGPVELLSGNPHGLWVVLYGVLAGLAIDLIWLLLARRHHPAIFMFAGGAGSATNLLVAKLAMSLPNDPRVTIGLFVLAGVAFISGALLGGALGWYLLQALYRAGVAGAQRPGTPLPAGRRAWAVVGVLGAALMLMGIIGYVSQTRRGDGALADKPVSRNISHGTMTPK
ncbi:MAG: ECF transporter S component [Phycisphaerae bacterium]|nr:ECF transporter S component [Phycisphaerae bacterium]